MRNLTATICLAVAWLFGSVGGSWSQDWQKGLAAYLNDDYATALREWEPLAKQGNAEAQRLLGGMYRNGKGVLQDYKAAVKWFRLAAEQGHTEAQYNLGGMYEEGQGVLQDYKTAAKWFTLGAEQGDVNAQNMLGTLNAMGRGFKQNWVYAHMWGNITASKGDDIGVRLRDLAAKKMTPSQLEKAQKLARECVRKNYKGC